MLPLEPIAFLFVCHPQMHPHFNAMQRGGNGGGVSLQPHRLPPPIASPHYQQNMQNAPVSVNQFNQRLVQEIQQNHPMLPFNRLNNNFNHHPQLNQIQMQHHNNNNNNNNNMNHGMNGKNPQIMQQMKVLGREKLWLKMFFFFFVICFFFAPFRTKSTMSMPI